MSKGLGGLQRELLEALAARASPTVGREWRPESINALPAFERGHYGWWPVEGDYLPGNVRASVSQWSSARRALASLVRRDWVEVWHGPTYWSLGRYNRTWWRPSRNMPRPGLPVALAPELDTLCEWLENDTTDDRDMLYLVGGLLRENQESWRWHFLQHAANNGTLARLQDAEYDYRG